MKKENLTLKNISEFQLGDSIYIQISEQRGFPHIFECTFIKLENGMVHGKVVGTDVNPSLYTHRIKEGWEISAKVTKCALHGTASNENRAYTHWFDSTGYAAYESIEKMREMMPKDHNSYGIINFSRSSSNKPNTLFGSTIKHSNTISLSIKRAQLTRDNNHDHIFGSGELIEIEMSESQFAQAITMFNRGEGTPVTIKHVNLERMDECPYISKVDQFSKEFEQDMKQLEHDLQSDLKKAKEILSSAKAPGKGEREIVLKAMEGLTKVISSKMPYLASSFNEQMDKTVTEAKKSIEIFMQNKANELGLNLDGNDKIIEIG